MTEPDTLQSLLRHLAGFGAAPAIVAFDGERSITLSFAAMTAGAASLAGALAERGIGPGACVAITGPNSAAWVIAFWAIIATGAVALPLDTQLGDEDVARMLAETGCRVVFTPAARAPRLPPGCDAIALDRALPSAAAASSLADAAASGDIALMLFTSGTTGTPKAVPLSHANLLSNVRALLAAGLVDSHDRAVLPLPLHHAYPLTVGMMTALAAGGAIILPAGVSGPELIGALQRGHATVLVGVPRLYTALLASIRMRIGGRKRLAARLFASLLALSLRLRPWLGTRPGKLFFRALHRGFAPELRLLVSGGAKLDGAVEETLGGLGWEVMTGYGMTETSPILAFNRPGASRPGSAGRALPGVELRVSNADESGVGEVEARGASVFAGYRGDPQATEAAFTADGWLRTGDFGRIDADGYLHIAARVSETIVLGDGKKLFPETTEAVYAAHPLIQEIALLAVEGQLVGLVVPDLDAVRLTGAVRLKNLLRDALAERARALPSHARLTGFALAREKLPRTQLGKIRRHLVPALYAQALSERTPSGPVEPAGEDKELLARADVAAAWAWLQQRYPDRSLDLDMSPQLDLGIDSLAWVDLTLALERDLGVGLTEQEIARIITLRDLLREVVAAKAAPQREAPQPISADALRAPGTLLLPLHSLISALIRLVMRRYFRLSVAGLEHLPADGAFLICPNHESYLDPFTIVAAVSGAQLRRTWWGGWTGIMHTSALRRFFSHLARIVPVDQDRAALSTLNLAGLVLARGETLVWFPEGGLTPDGTLKRFLPGVGALVERHPVPIVPAAIDGAFESWPVGKRFPPNRHTIRLRFGKPLDPAPLIEAGGANLAQRIADAVREEVVKLAQEMEGGE